MNQKIERRGRGLKDERGLGLIGAGDIMGAAGRISQLFSASHLGYLRRLTCFLARLLASTPFICCPQAWRALV